ncbi:MAG TPA: AMP-binding protein [Syntrophorhabdaceae bacterium]|nr:AMP-binding protein [Syntrophorhabdaceae bacterium]
MNLARNLEASAYFFPERPAISEGDRKTNYYQLNIMANRIATGLIKQGVKPGDFVAMCYPNSTE